MTLLTMLGSFGGRGFVIFWMMSWFAMMALYVRHSFLP
jgi:hypothetical protein